MHISSPHGENHISLLPLPQTDFTFSVQVCKTDSFIEGLDLPVVDIAAPLGDETSCLSAGGTETGFLEQLECRYSLAPAPPGSFQWKESRLYPVLPRIAVWCWKGKSPSSTGLAPKASAEAFQAATAASSPWVIFVASKARTALAMLRRASVSVLTSGSPPSAGR